MNFLGQSGDPSSGASEAELDPNEYSRKTVIIGGKTIQSISLNELKVAYAAIISEDGWIVHVQYYDAETEQEAWDTYDSIFTRWSDADSHYQNNGLTPSYGRKWYGGSKFIIPGFVDTHCHAPQYAFTGTGMDLPLLQWLEKYTFPCESKFEDVVHARKVYEKSVKAHLNNGSTFCSYFATIHSPAALVLADVCDDLGQRAFVGKVSMDRNSPDFYIEETKKGCDDVEAFARDVFKRTKAGASYIEEIDDQINGRLLALGTGLPRVLPAVTPRFVPTCTEEMMRELGRIASKYDLPIQSHLSENVDECHWVAALHPEIKGYGNVYKEMGLLNDKTYMAHCVYSDKEERQLMREVGCGVCHCPSSNFSLGSGVMDIRVFLNEGIKVGLGTDVAGGYSPSMLDAIRQAITASMVSSIRRRDLINKQKEAGKTTLEDDEQPLAPLSYKEAFYLATLGGAEAIGMGGVMGNFAPGKAMDCLVVDVECPESPIDLFGTEDVLEKFQKFLYLGDDRNITHIYVGSSLVKGTDQA